MLLSYNKLNIIIQLISIDYKQGILSLKLKISSQVLIMSVLYFN